VVVCGAWCVIRERLCYEMRIRRREEHQASEPDSMSVDYD
jgi:hypothetical protein